MNAGGWLARALARLLRPIVREAVAEAMERLEAKQRASDLQWPSGRRPAFWADLEVRRFLIDAHREMTIDAALAAALERFGAGRCPCRSTIGRFWQRLDDEALDHPRDAA